MIEDSMDLEQRNIDDSKNLPGLEDEDIMAVCALMIFNILFHRALKPIVYDWLIGRIYDSIFLYYFELLIVLPLLLIAVLKIIKFRKTKGYIYNSLYLIDTRIGKEYDPFEHYPVFEKREGIR